MTSHQFVSGSSRVVSSGTVPGRGSGQTQLARGGRATQRSATSGRMYGIVPASGRVVKGVKTAATRIYRAGKSYYYIKRGRRGRYSYVVVQVPFQPPARLHKSADNGITNAANAGGSSQDVASIVSAIARNLLHLGQTGGGAIGRLMGVQFPLVPVLFGLVLTGLGVLVRRQTLGLASHLSR